MPHKLVEASGTADWRRYESVFPIAAEAANMVHRLLGGAGRIPRRSQYRG